MSIPNTALDTSDVDKWIGKQIVFAEFWDECNATDIRRWVQAMDYANPLHWDEEFARSSKFQGIIGPQSFVLAMDFGHSGMHAAVVGCIPDAHMIVGSEEWWYSGYRIRPGDKVIQNWRFDGFTVKETAFAGPTVFSRGDTFHQTTHGAPIAHSRTTALRYSAEEAEKRAVYGKSAGARKRWTAGGLAEVDRVRRAWLLSNRVGRTPRIGEIKVGDRLPRRVVGPHSIASFSSEWRAFLFQTWGSHGWKSPEGVEDPWVANDPGTVKGFELDREGAKIDPRLTDGLYMGPARGHVDSSSAQEVGMGGAYGYGASMSAWYADYLEYWAGHDGRVRHTKLAIKGPAFEGDATYIDGEVVEVEALSPLLGVPLATIKVRLTNQDGVVLIDGTSQVEVDF
jgi:acyl dehydratase